jgi:hypothetical protein
MSISTPPAGSAEGSVSGYFDALAYHEYSFPNLPTIAPIQAIHNVMVANGDGSNQICSPRPVLRPAPGPTP